ncbi:MAG: ester cyclase [Candidatus Methylarchaceae archaeon HK02M2]|nr:ester cyclase [Candidatus Methylarchaceae archaeon HK02M2]
MSLEENKSIVRRWIEEYNKHNLDSFDEFIAPDYVDHTNQVDRDGLKQLFTMGFTGFPDWHETIEDIIAEGDKVWVRLSYTGTHTGEFMGLPPTGKKITSKGVDIYRIVNGKLAEYWNVIDNVDMFKQIGAIEITEKGKKLFPEDVK